MKFLCGTLSLHHHFPTKSPRYSRSSIRFVPRLSHHRIHKNNPGTNRAAFRQKMSDAWLIEPIGSEFLKCSILLILCITMTGNFTRRTARGIRQLRVCTNECDTVCRVLLCFTPVCLYGGGDTGRPCRSSDWIEHRFREISCGCPGR